MTSAIDRALMATELANSVYPSGSLNLNEAWLGIYQTLLWYEHGLPHIIDANELRGSSRWRDRARAAEKYLADALGVSTSEMPQMVDRMMSLPRWKGKQRNNPLGNGFRTLLHVVLEQFGSHDLIYDQEAKATVWFPGIRLPGRSTTPSIDILVSKARKTGGAVPKAVVSCKWSNRHDRSSDPTNECPQYKSASLQMGNAASHLLYVVATSEMYDRRVEKLTNQQCVDFVVHTHLPLFEHLNGGPADFQGSEKLIDLTKFVRMTADW